MRFASVLALFAAATEAKERQQVTADGRLVVEENGLNQSVQLGIDDDLCIFKNGWDKWCISTITPMARIGIEWDQTWDQTDRSSNTAV